MSDKHPVFVALEISNPPQSMRYPEPGFYYVQYGLGWEVWQWTGINWYSPGNEIPEYSGQVILGRVPDLPTHE